MATTTNKTSGAGFTGWATQAGIDLIYKDEAGEETRVPRIAYSPEMIASLNETPLTVVLGNDDDEFIIEYGDHIVTMVRQPKNHFWGWLNPLPEKSPLISLAEARKLAGKSKK